MAAPSGTVWGATVGGYGRIGIKVDIAEDRLAIYATCGVWFWSKYSVSDTNNGIYFDWHNGGTAVNYRGSANIQTSVNSGSGWSTSNQVLLFSNSATFLKGRGAGTVPVSARLTGVDKVGPTATMTVATSISIPMLESYTVSYNANGGTGAPGNQTKWYGSILTLSSASPSRTGYTFQGWSIYSGGPVHYQPGGQFGVDQNTTLYAIWTAHTYTVKYNANGGTGAPGNQTKTYGKNLTLSSTRPTRTNYNFLGWGTSASSTTVAYSPGSTYSSNSGITLYAIWELAYEKPRISNLTADRCLADGTLNDEGEYALVKFKWSTDKTVTRIYLMYRSTTGPILDTVDVDVSDFTNNGSVTQVIGSDMSTESDYMIGVAVEDSMGSTQTTIIVPPLAYIIDFHKGGDGVAIGKPSDGPGFEVAMDVNFFDKISFKQDGDGGYIQFDDNHDTEWLLYGGAENRFRMRRYYNNTYAYPISISDKYIYDSYNTPISNGLSIYTGNGSNAINPNTSLEHTFLTDKNTPNGEVMYIVQYFYGSKSTSSNRMQIAYPYDSPGSEYHRYCAGGKWSAWRRHVNDDEDNKVLLNMSGGAYMHGEQTVYLNEAISAQRNGIVLVWCLYLNGAPNPSRFSEFYIPKKVVSDFNSRGHHCNALSTFSDFGHMGKYVYIYDTYIKGHNNNISTITMDGVTFKNTNYVLVKVYGV